MEQRQASGTVRVVELCEQLAVRQYGLITRTQALQLGMPLGTLESRVKRAIWRRILPQVFAMPGAPSSVLQSFMAACLWAGPTSVVSHRAAAHLWEMHGEGGDLWVPVQERGACAEISILRRVKHPAVIVHRVQVPRADVMVIQGIRVTTATRTLIDLAGVLDPACLETILEDALRRRITSLRHLLRRLDHLAVKGRPGVKALRALLSQRQVGDREVGSVLEARLFRILRKARLPLPTAQFEIYDDSRFVARVDFAFPEAKLAIDGRRL